MFKAEYIYNYYQDYFQMKVYKHFISVVSNFVRKYNWLNQLL